MEESKSNISSQNKEIRGRVHIETKTKDVMREEE